ncbi:MAG: hypothetical protein JXA78_14215 [Anaerolineales bacterium]|nr:hypothetical protein [Anaerolineales bacterium]
MTVLTVDETQQNFGAKSIPIFPGSVSSKSSDDTILVGSSRTNQSAKMYAVHPLTNTLVEIDPEQAWFWTRDWLHGELEAENEIRTGNYEEYSSIDDFIASL